MDTDTAEVIQALTRMIDHVHSTFSLNRLQFNITIALAANARRRGELDKVAIDMIEGAFEEIGAEIEEEPYDKSRALFAAARDLWKAAGPSNELS